MWYLSCLRCDHELQILHANDRDRCSWQCAGERNTGDDRYADDECHQILTAKGELLARLMLHDPKVDRL